MSRSRPEAAAASGGLRAARASLDETSEFTLQDVQPVVIHSTSVNCPHGKVIFRYGTTRGRAVNGAVVSGWVVTDHTTCQGTLVEHFDPPLRGRAASLPGGSAARPKAPRRFEPS